MKKIFLAVEGQHDIAVIGKMLELQGIRRKHLKSTVERFWYRLIPKDFPVDDNLLQRVPVPRFFQNEEFSIAVFDMVGHTKITSVMNNLVFAVDCTNLYAVGIVCDADHEAVIKRFDEIKTDIKAVSEPIICDSFSSLELGKVSETSPKSGIFILPDNSSHGCLDSVLLECAATSYDDLLPSATSYVENVPEVYRNKWKPYDREKAIVGCVSNILRPGKSNQVSLEDNKWVCPCTISEVSGLAEMNNFLLALIS
jgi:hypothetical protein